MSRRLFAVPLVAALVALAGCSNLMGPPDPLIKVGECAGPLSGTVVKKIPTVPCTGDHNWEAYATQNVADAAAYPGEAVMKKQAEDFCSAQFEQFIGIPYDNSDLDIQYLYPTTDSWGQRDREITCLVGLDDRTSTGSLKGSQK